MLQFNAEREHPQLARLDELVTDEDVMEYLKSIGDPKSMSGFYKAIINAVGPNKILLTAFLIHEKTEVCHRREGHDYDDSHFEALKSESSYLLENAKSRDFETTQGDIILVDPVYAYFLEGKFRNEDWEFYQKRTEDKKRVVDDATLKGLEFYLSVAPGFREKLEHIQKYIIKLAEHEARLHL
ncbi:hypothetical protein KY339_01395 [Candidatus Woesearchaeota archaeon]|nr:hypothetical protein [Candidatus Woesearchaeota archaeon]